jgi:hypothetical protein
MTIAEVIINKGWGQITRLENSRQTNKDNEISVRRETSRNFRKKEYLTEKLMRLKETQ